MTRRIGTAISLLVIVLVIALAVPLVILYRNYQYEKLQLSLERDALVVASDLSEMPTGAWYERIKAYENQTGVRVTAVDRAQKVIIDSEGAPTGSSFSRPEISQGLDGNIVTIVRYSNTLGETLRTVVVPIRDDNGVVGALRLSVPESAIEEQVRALVFALAMVLLGVLVLAIVISWLIARALNRPLKKLVVGAHQVGQDPRARVGDINGPPEIQDVADALDDTAGALDRMIENSRVVAAEASHQIRTPLAALRLRLENLLESTPADGQQDAQAAIDEVDRLTRRVDQVMALTTAVEGSQREVVDVGQASHQRVLDWQMLASDRSVELHCTYVTALVSAPIGSVERILDELVSNAMTYASTRVDVHVTVQDDNVVLSVGDDGPGISQADRAHIFERFARGSNAAPGGSGLGLALVAQAVAASDGQVTIAEAASGTVFEVRWTATTSPQA